MSIEEVRTNVCKQDRFILTGVFLVFQIFAMNSLISSLQCRDVTGQINLGTKNWYPP